MSQATVTETYKTRLRQYKRREQMVIWVGAGLAGLVALCTGDAFNNAPAWLKAIEVTTIIIGGAFFALARVKFEWAATVIERKIHDGVSETEALKEEDVKWPADAEDCWDASRFCVLLGGLIMAVCFWWPVFGGGK